MTSDDNTNLWTRLRQPEQARNVFTDERIKTTCKVEWLADPMIVKTPEIPHKHHTFMTEQNTTENSGLCIFPLRKAIYS